MEFASSKDAREHLSEVVTRVKARFLRAKREPDFKALLELASETVALIYVLDDWRELQRVEALLRDRRAASPRRAGARAGHAVALPERRPDPDAPASDQLLDEIATLRARRLKGKRRGSGKTKRP